MRKPLLLLALLICTFSFGQKGQFGFIQTNEVNLHDDMFVGFGISHSNGKQYFAASVNVYNPSNSGKALNRLRFDYRHYISKQIGVFHPFIAVGAGFFKDKHKSSDWTYLEPFQIDHCNPDNPDNEPIYCWLDTRTVRKNLSVGIGVGTDIQICRNFSANFTLNAQYYQRSKGVEKFYYTRPHIVKTSNYGKNGFSPSFRFGLEYRIPRRKKMLK